MMNLKSLCLLFLFGCAPASESTSETESVFGQSYNTSFIVGFATTSGFLPLVGGSVALINDGGVVFRPTDGAGFSGFGIFPAGIYTLHIFGDGGNVDYTVDDFIVDNESVYTIVFDGGRSGTVPLYDSESSCESQNTGWECDTLRLGTSVRFFRSREIEAPPDRGIRGMVEGIIDSGGYALVGWACAENTPQSIIVQAYAGGPPGTGRYLTQVIADRTSEPLVSTICGTQGVPHRFAIPIDAFVASQQGEPLYVYGINPNAGVPNGLASQSGIFRIPAAPRDTSGWTNFVRNKRAWSNGTELAQYASPVANLIDGSMNTYAYPGQLNLDYTIDLAGTYHATWVRMTPGPFGYSSPHVYITSYEISGWSEAANAWVVLGGGGIPNARFVEFPANLDVRQIRIRAASTTNWIGVYELEVFGWPVPSNKGASSSALADFTGDGCADFADQYTPNGNFWIHPNYGNGSFWGDALPMGTAAGGPDWRTYAGDFTGDGRADYVDYHVPSGNYWIHQNAWDGRSWSAKDWGSGWALAAGPDRELLVGDFTGDGRADFAERSLSTGQIFVRRNDGPGAEQFPYVNGGSSYRSMFGPNWTVLVADFDGDRLADIAEAYAGGRFFVHRNLGGATGDFEANWSSYASVAPSSQGWKTIVGDFTGDGRADFADLWTGHGGFWIHRNLGNGSFDPNYLTYTQSTRWDSSWRLLGE